MPTRLNRILAVALPEAAVEIGAPEHHLDALTGKQSYVRAWFEDEAPQHVAHVRGFSIDVHPVTNAAWAAFVDATGHRSGAETRGYGLVYGAHHWEPVAGAHWRTPGGSTDTVERRMDHPVVHVDLADALAYTRWAGRRLPTEAEWEYAAHGPRWRPWPWGKTWDRHRAACAEYLAAEPLSDLPQWRMWWRQHYASRGTVPATTPVGTFSPCGDSPTGVADMAGNVSEWTADPYRPYHPTRDYDPIYRAAATCGYRSVRGGGWMHLRHQLRTTERFAADPAYSNHALGFRCAD